MRKLSLLASICLLLAACNQTIKVSGIQEAHPEQKNIGGNKDKHGCLTAAGQTWSQLRKDCVQLFNVGKRLNPVVSGKNEAIISAFILLNKESDKCELFLPNTDFGSLILNKTAKNIFEKDIYMYDDSNSTLSIDGKVLYKAE